MRTAKWLAINLTSGLGSIQDKTNGWSPHTPCQNEGTYNRCWVESLPILQVACAWDKVMDTSWIYSSICVSACTLRPRRNEEFPANYHAIHGFSCHKVVLALEPGDQEVLVRLCYEPVGIDEWSVT